MELTEDQKQIFRDSGKDITTIISMLTEDKYKDEYKKFKLSVKEYNKKLEKAEIKNWGKKKFYD